MILLSLYQTVFEMTTTPTKKGWWIVLAIFLILVILIFLIPTFITHYAKNKMIETVENKTHYHLEIGELKLLGWHGFKATDIKLRPKLDKEAYNKENNYHSDWITIEVKELQLEAIDWKRYFSHKYFFAERLCVLGPDIYAFRDKTMADPPFVYKALPAQLLRESSLQFTVPVIEIKQGKVTYEEIPPKGGTALKVPFSELNGWMLHLSSDSAYYHSNPVTLRAKGKILDKIDAHMSYSFETTDKQDKFLLEGHMGEFDAALMNQYAVPQASMEITSGHVDSIWFKMEANKDVSDGILHLDYHDLKMTTKEKKKPKKFVELKALAAKLFVKEKNEVLQREKLGHIHFERTKDRFIFNYIWNSFKTGVASVVVNVPDKLLQKQLGKQKKPKR